MTDKVSRELWAWAGFCLNFFFLDCVEGKKTRVFEGIETNFTNIKDRWVHIFDFILVGHDINDWDGFEIVMHNLIDLQLVLYRGGTLLIPLSIITLFFFILKK